MNQWINKDTEIYCSFAETAGNTGCQMMNTAFHYYGLNKIYKSFSVKSIEDAVNAVKVLDIKGFAITMPYKIDVLNYVDDMSDDVKEIGAANTVLNFNNGFLHAYNTDAYAATTLLDESVILTNLLVLPVLTNLTSSASPKLLDAPAVVPHAASEPSNLIYFSCFFFAFRLAFNIAS